MDVNLARIMKVKLHEAYTELNTTLFELYTMQISVTILTTFKAPQVITLNEKKRLAGRKSKTMVGSDITEFDIALIHLLLPTC